ncbi:MAG TPA: aldolase [Hypericibacter adhaerens]|uniref:HPr kinase/phosphorylase n=1 Tax=Hypericibacter adhaerens TaxID=2602016 RepID=UPI002CE545C8|nr:aldolase [Hypericibacter adhaerens]HWA43978.1 aldolase [Hypericibacter adhaerens]
MSRENIHATGLVLGRTGLILRGPPGAGKSLLALELIDIWEARGQVAKLVSDDRVDIEAAGGRLTMYAPRAIAGLIELRGRGIVSRPHVASATLHLVVDLVDTLERMVEEDALVTTLGGLRLARCPVPRAGIVDSRHQLLLIREALRALNPRRPGRKKTA